MVAENSMVWRFTGICAMIFSTSRRKPISSIRSASSSTKYRTCWRFTRRWFIRSKSLPGVATRYVDPGAPDAPPAASAIRRRRSPCFSAPETRRRWKSSSPICAASSRVGESTSAWMVLTLPGTFSWYRCCRMGMANAAVLPVPVCAQPSRSRRSSSGGIACS